MTAREELVDQYRAITAMANALAIMMLMCQEVAGVALTAKENAIPLDPDWVIDTILAATTDVRDSLPSE